MNITKGLWKIELLTALLIAMVIIAVPCRAAQTIDVYMPNETFVGEGCELMRDGPPQSYICFRVEHFPQVLEGSASPFPHPLFMFDATSFKTYAFFECTTFGEGYYFCPLPNEIFSSNFGDDE
jgi:hypothetical protein